MNLLARRGAGIGATIALALGLVLTSAPAQAKENQKALDVTSYSVSDVVFSNSECKDIAIKPVLKKRISTADEWSINFGVWFKGNELETGQIIKGNSYDKVNVCPDDIGFGLGKYTVGPADVYAEYTYKQNGYNEWSYLHYMDYTKKSFYVRGAVKSNLTAKRKGTKVTLSTSASVFAAEKDRWQQYNPKNAKLQVKSGKTWKTVKTLKLNKGKASVTLKDSKKKTYRVTLPKATWAVAKTSNAVTK